MPEPVVCLKAFNAEYKGGYATLGMKATTSTSQSSRSATTAARTPASASLPQWVDCQGCSQIEETSAGYREVEPSGGSNVIPRQARPGLAGLRPHTCRKLTCRVQQPQLVLSLPLSTECGPYETVHARFWLWPSVNNL